MFPFQIYIFSQAEGDIYATRSEYVILEFYLIQLFSLSIRMITKTITKVLEKDAIPEIMSSFAHTPLGELVPHALSFLYIFNYSINIAHHLQSDLEDLALLWCKLLSICKIHVFSYSSLLFSSIHMILKVNLLVGNLFIVILIILLLRKNHGS